MNVKQDGQASPPEAIMQWFDAVGTAGIVLPTGWFGRPYDSRYALHACQSVGNHLLLELDAGMSFVFIGDVVVTRKNERMSVSASKGFLFIHGLSESGGPTIEYFAEEVNFDATPGPWP